MKIIVFFYLILPLMLSSPVWAADHHPFTGYSFSYKPIFVDSDKKLYIFGTEVLPGDRIILDTEEIINFKRALGQGSNTALIEDSEGRAIRLPLDFNDWDTRAAFLRYGDALEDLNRLMSPDFVVQKANSPTSSQLAQFVERLDIEFLLEDYLTSDSIDRNSLKYWSLLSFIAEVTRFKFIEDFAPFQIGWVKDRGWVLFDFDSPIAINSPGEYTTPADIFYNWDPIENWTFYVPDQILKNIIKDFEIYKAYQENACQVHFTLLVK